MPRSLTSAPVASAPTLGDVVQAEQAYVARAFRRLGVSESDVADLTQDLFLALHLLLPRYDPARPLRPWLFTIARRMACRNRERANREAQLPPVDNPRQIVDGKRSAEQLAMDAELRALCDAALQAIHPSRRDVFVMAHLDEVSVPEIAERCGIPLNTAYSRLRLARTDFRRAFVARQKS